ncbi:hypothetical protein X794_02635 [Dehalococcoides mccartyi CG5]|nr:hypothetical protein X794_02635 [Dehalococcoides mccartyi CG5]
MAEIPLSDEAEVFFCTWQNVNTTKRALEL